jgi:N-acyl-D-aspartate/D-glutamate deacylase
LQGGLILDGTGAEPFPGDLVVEGDRIGAVLAAEGPARDDPPAAREVIDVRDRVVAPGFIDIHSHSDWILPQPDHGLILRPLLEQGVTTLVTGNCGFAPAPVNPEVAASFDAWSDMLRDQKLAWDWSSVESFFDHLEREDLLFNVAHLAGHGSLRLSTMGRLTGQPSDAEREAMRAQVREALEEGAVGLSTGLGYAPGMFAGFSELTDLAAVVAEKGGLFTSHLKAYTWISPFYGVNPFRWVDHNLRAVRDILTVAERSGARLQISHLIFVGPRTWRNCERVIREIEDARERGVDVAFDCFPYTGGNTTIRVIYPPWMQDDLLEKLQQAKVRALLRAQFAILRRVIGIGFEHIQLLWAANDDYACYEGMTFDRIAQELDLSPYDAYFRLTAASEARARVMLHTYSGNAQNEAPLRHVMAHPLSTVETDTILVSRGHHNPASFGTFPRVLGRYVREEKLMSLPEAVFKMTGAAADRLGLRDRGRIQEGQQADIVVFDPETVGCEADFSNPAVPPTGIEQVLVNGRVVVTGGRWNGRSAGHVLRRGR